MLQLGSESVIQLCNKRRHLNHVMINADSENDFFANDIYISFECAIQDISPIIYVHEIIQKKGKLSEQ